MILINTRLIYKPASMPIVHRQYYSFSEAFLRCPLHDFLRGVVNQLKRVVPFLRDRFAVGMGIRCAARRE